MRPVGLVLRRRFVMKIKPFIRPWQLFTVVLIWFVGSAVARSVAGPTVAWRLTSVTLLIASVVLVTAVERRRAR